eukprot:TRINITY_DN91559_c0_g1_i1.p1 TRINITY_DN91559_c0_g1~~TRINITY_DN91559_c0_g1_i1.p1  ORF type:complete len:479 (-),score=66.50 TRINITY_DN91559_c0_g1_i1:140-1576(-)
MSYLCFASVLLASGLQLFVNSEEDTCPQHVNFLQTAVSTISRRETRVDHHWPTARGPMPGQYGSSTVVLGKNLTAHLAWAWRHSPDGQRPTVAGGPVIDSDKNLYMITQQDGLIKFSPKGTILWIYETPGKSNNEPALLGTSIFGSTTAGFAFAVDINSGRELWKSKLADKAGGDCGYPAAHDGVFVVAAGGSIRGGGNAQIFGLNSTSGEQLWRFEPQIGVWNFMPLFPGDGSFAFMDWAGGVYRLGLRTGTPMWHSAPGTSLSSFTDGGASLAPNGAVHTCSNYGLSQGTPGSNGVARAYSLEDGKLLWEHILPQPCNSYPAVGHIKGSNALAVVHSPGSFKSKWSTDPMHGSIMSFDATSGDPIWMYQAPTYAEMLWAGEPHCGPAHWSAPTISGDGTVYVARSDGVLYAVRGPDASLAQSGPQKHVPTKVDFPSSAGMDVETFSAGSSSLHGAMAWAPGMLGYASCDTLFVFNV